MAPSNDAAPRDRFATAEFHLVFEGEPKKGGSMTIRYRNDRIFSLDLPALEWSAMALLARAALSGVGLAAYVSASELASQLQQLGVTSDNGPRVAIGTIYKLRNRFSAEPAKWPNAAPKLDLKTGLVVTHTNKRFGYRLNALPEQIELVVLGDQESTV